MKGHQKCRELDEIIVDLKECFSFDDGGVKPVRASGSRWVTHKLKGRVSCNKSIFLLIHIWIPLIM